jgi:hypothetical protein
MKIKISFNKNAILKFFIDHIEKVVFGLFMLAFAVVIYGAVMRRDKFDKTPQQLNEQCNVAQQRLGGGRNIIMPKSDDYKKKAQEFEDKKSIDEADYRCPSAWNQPLFPQKAPRGKPVLCAVKELRASAELGAFRTSGIAAGRPRGGGGAGDTSGKSWVVITGLVPIEAQANAYAEAFKDSIIYDPATDSPVYKCYWVDRAEINSPADVEKPNWSKTFLSTNAEDEAMKEWGAQGQPDVVEAKYVDPALTFPLGPLVNRSWDSSVAHDDEIPYLSSPDQANQEYRRIGMTRDREYAPDTRIDPYTQRPIRPGMPQPVTAPRGYGEGIVAEKPPKYKLFRFFDFSVEPGKSYMYRVRLGLQNPNYGLKGSLLKEAALAQKEILEAPENPEKKDVEESIQTKVVYVPKDTRLLVKSVEQKSTGPAGEVVLVKWMKDTGQEVYQKFNIDRGQVLNYKNQDAVVVGGVPSTSGEEDKEKTNLLSDATVLDMAGGGKLSRRDPKLTEPGVFLVMEMQNNLPVLAVRDEEADMSEVERVTFKPEITRGREGMGPRGGGRYQPGRDEKDIRTLLRGAGGERDPRTLPRGAGGEEPPPRRPTRTRP